MWLYGSGFPKSMNIGLAVDKKNGVESKVIGIKEHCKKDFKESNLYAQDEANKNNTKCFGYGIEIIKEAQNQWRGWGTALKPSFEPIIVARKPLEGTCVDNVIKYGVGGINIDECRTETNGELIDNHKTAGIPFMRNSEDYEQLERSKSTNGRFPSNTILTYDDSDYDEVCGGFPVGGRNGSISKHYKMNNQVYGEYGYCNTWDAYEDEGSASRYFYCAKASRKDRDDGLEQFDLKEKVFNGKSDKSSTDIKDVEARFTTQLRNIHPTVKPTELMQYLVRLVTPRGGIVLDPFMGSGSTGKAVMFENRERNADYKFIGVELGEEYCSIANARISFVIDGYVYKKDDTKVDKLKEVNGITLW